MVLLVLGVKGIGYLGETYCATVLGRGWVLTGGDVAILGGSLGKVGS